MSEFTLDSFRVGDRVQIHPATDLWMRGARYGDITAIGRKHLTVKMDRLNKPIKISPENICEIVT